MPTATTDKQAADRLRICNGCEFRSVDRCTRLNKMVSVIAKQATKDYLICPQGKLPGQNPPVAMPVPVPLELPFLFDQPVDGRTFPIKKAPPATIERIAVATCYFNPQRYRRIRDNYCEFRERMARYDVDLFVIEMAFDDDGFELPDSNLRVRGTSRLHKLWQKERLLNLMIDEIPDKYDAIGWFDCDILFQNWNWVDGVKDSLSRYTWIQPYSGSWFTETDGSLTNLKRSMGWYLHNDPQNFLHFGKAHPGFAWVARADWLRKHKLCDTNITGGGDALMVKGITSQPLFIEPWLNPDWLSSVQRWADEARADGGDCFGFVPGDVVHLYHGTRSNRKYRERWDYLTGHDYNPATDIETDPQNGLIRWTDHAIFNKHRMVELVSGYFRERQEDD